MPITTLIQVRPVKDGRKVVAFDVIARDCTEECVGGVVMRFTGLQSRIVHRVEVIASVAAAKAKANDLASAALECPGYVGDK